MSITFKGGVKMPAGSKMGLAPFDKVLLESVPVGSGTQFAKWFGGGSTERYKDVAVDSNNNIYAVGETNSWAAKRMLISKWDNDGNHLWSKRFGELGTYSNELNAINIDNNDNIFVAGMAVNLLGSQRSPICVKFDTDGTVIWGRHFYTGGGGANGVVTDSTGSVYIAGWNRQADYSLMGKWDNAGEHAWKYSMGSSAHEYFYNVDIDSSNNIGFVGKTRTYGGTSEDDAIILVVDVNSQIVWSGVIGGGSNDGFHDVAVDSNDNFITVGYTASFGNAGTDPLICKWDSSGNLLWSKYFDLGASGDNQFLTVDTDTQGNIYAAGHTTTLGGSDNDPIVAKFDSNGTMVWAKYMNSSSYDTFSGLVIDTLGNIIITGDSGVYGGADEDAVLIKLYADGSSSSTAFVDISNTSEDAGATKIAGPTSLSNRSGSKRIATYTTTNISSPPIGDIS